MSGKAFVDTNVFVYLYTNKEPEKNAVALKIIERCDCVVSVQVLNEFASVMMKKYKLTPRQVMRSIDEILENVDTIQNGAGMVRMALFICERYGYSYYDSCIIAAALESGCKILYTEDMSDGQTIEDRLTIRNAFSNKTGESIL
jgi:predicted nucleic acid-binding protein